MTTMTTKVALAMVAGLTLTACFDPRFWWGHGHEPGHGHGECKKDKRHCPEECPSATHFETEAGECRRKALTLSAGGFYTCAVLSGGAAKCWGSNGGWYGLGYAPSNEDRGDEPGEMGNALPAIDLGDGLTATDVYADGDVTCALIEEGRLKCWGYNGYGLVTGVMDDGVVGLPVADSLLRTFSSEVVQVVAGSGFAITLHADGTLSSVRASTSPYPLDGALAVQIARGLHYDDWRLCAVIDDGSVSCKDESTVTAIDLGAGNTATQVAGGYRHDCALLDDGGVKCWGANEYGQLGQDDTTPLDPSEVAALTPVALGQPAIAVAAGWDHTCAILIDGSVKCWGFNEQGQLGIGTTENMGNAAGEMAALPSVDLGTGRTAVAIDAGFHSCALLDNGGIKCWGPNASGQLGQGDTATRGDAPGELGDALPEIDLGS